jgi:hypothetical protein
VTPEITRWTYERQRAAAVALCIRELGALQDELSISDRLAPVPAALRARLEEADVAPDEDRFPRESYRRLLGRMMRVARGRPAYTAERLLAELDLMRALLEETGFGDVARQRPAPPDAAARGADVRAPPGRAGRAAAQRRARARARRAARGGGVATGYAALDEAGKLERAAPAAA